METEQEQKLRKLLTEVYDSYDDFVFGGMLIGKRYNLTDSLIDLITNSEHISTSEVIDAIDDMTQEKKGAKN